MVNAGRSDLQTALPLEPTHYYLPPTMEGWEMRPNRYMSSFGLPSRIAIMAPTLLER